MSKNGNRHVVYNILQFVVASTGDRLRWLLVAVEAVP